MNLNPTETRKEDLKTIEKIITNNTLDGIRSVKEYYTQALMSLERRLMKLKASEAALNQRIYRDLEMAEIEAKYSADHFKKINPIQSYSFYDSGTPDPHERVTYTRNKLLYLSPNAIELIKEQNKIAYQIKDVQSRITSYSNELDKVNKQLEEKGAPEQADLERDNIVKRQVADIYMLWELHSLYKANSRDFRGNEAYTEDAKIVNLLNKLSVKFTAFAERNPYVVNGDLVLDLTNPGSDANSTALLNFMSGLRSIGVNTKLPASITKYVEEMTKNINDPYISLRLSSKKTPKDEPSLEDSAARSTSSLSRFLDRTRGVANWWTTNALKSAAEAENRAFRKAISFLNGNRGYCNNPSKTAEEQAREAAINQQKAAEAKAQEEFQRKASEAVATSPTDRIATYDETLSKLYAVPDNILQLQYDSTAQEYTFSVKIDTSQGSTELKTLSGFKNSQSYEILSVINEYVGYLLILFYQSSINQQEYDSYASKIITDYESWTNRA